MPVLVVGVDFTRAPLELLERVTFGPDALEKALLLVRSGPDVREAVILSTCNRVEVYAEVTGFHAGTEALRRFFSEFHDLGDDELGERLIARFEEDAVAHLFAVAAGIESMAVGELQILGQVRRAFRTANEEGATGAAMRTLFHRAIRVGRRVRAETGIARTAASLAHAGVSLARSRLGSLAERTVLIVGAGEMADIAARAIAAQGARVLVANRTAARGRALAARAGGEAVPITGLARAIERADLLLTSTGSHEPIVTREMIETAMTARGRRSLVVLDLAVPRNVEPSAGAVPGVTLHDLDDLRSVLALDAEGMREIERARAIVDDEGERFLAWRRSRSIAPLIEALHERAEEARAVALGHVSDLSERDRAAVDAATRSVVQTMLHEQIEALKRMASTTEGDRLAAALRALWRIGDR